jgi:urease gamma subunit
MQLAPREWDHLRLHQAGVLAQRRLAMGVRLNMPESCALISTVTLELIRQGKSVAELCDGTGTRDWPLPGPIQELAPDP